MGTDEHGPAYPEPYVCPVCDAHGSNTYMSCNRPACPDGRDQRRALYIVQPDRTSDREREKEFKRRYPVPDDRVKCPACLFMSALLLGGVISFGIFYVLNALH